MMQSRDLGLGKYWPGFWNPRTKSQACSGSSITKRQLILKEFHNEFCDDRAVQWHYIDKLSNDTVPNHTLITTNHQALFIYNRTNIAG